MPLLLSSTDVHQQPSDVVRPVLSGDLRVGLNSVSIRLVDRICVVLACLDGLAFELLRNLGNQLVIVGERCRLFILDLRGVSKAALFGAS